jgi:uncharacterized protein (DUF1778 family)
MEPQDIDMIDRAAALRDEARAAYMRRVILREAGADLREAERKQQQQQQTAVA